MLLGNQTDTQEDTEFNNKVTPPETPEFQPEKFVVSKEKYDITGNKLMDDDDDVLVTSTQQQMLIHMLMVLQTTNQKT